MTESEMDLAELSEVLERAASFVQPRPDYAGRCYSFSELIRAALVREDLEDWAAMVRKETP